MKESLPAMTSDTAATPQDIATLPPGTIAPKSAYLSGEIARKAAAVRIPAYRFYNSRTGSHFFTTSETERANASFEEQRRLGMKLSHNRARSEPLLEMLGGIALAGILYLAGLRIAAEQMTR